MHSCKPLCILGAIDGNFITIEMQSQFKEAFPALYAEFMHEEASKKASRKKKGTSKIQSVVKGASCAGDEPEKAIEMTTKKKKDITKVQPEVEESEHELEEFIKKTKKSSAEMQSEVSATLSDENEQDKKTIKKKKTGMYYITTVLEAKNYISGL